MTRSELEEKCDELQDRINDAIVVLQAAPDVIEDETSKRLAKDVSRANKIAWAILTSGKWPESVRYER